MKALNKIEIKVYISDSDNDDYFDQKYPTFRNAFCEKIIKVSLINEEYGIVKMKGMWVVIDIEAKTIEIAFNDKEEALFYINK